MPEWASSLIDGATGPYGALVLSVAMNIALVIGAVKVFFMVERLNDARHALELQHVKDLAAAEAKCVAEKAQYRKDCDAEKDRALVEFRARDDQKRADVIRCFDKLDDAIEKMVDAMGRTDQTLRDVQIELAKQS